MCAVALVGYEFGSPAVGYNLGSLGIGCAIKGNVSASGERIYHVAGDEFYSRTHVNLWRGEARQAGYVVLVETESDVFKLWYHGAPALAVTGGWREERDAPRVADIETIFFVIGPERAVPPWLSRSIIRHRVRLITGKDLAMRHVKNRDDFAALWQIASIAALPWTVFEQQTLAEERAEHWNHCADLARSANILDRLDTALDDLGVVGDSIRLRTIIVQQKTGRPVPFELTESTREALASWLRLRGLRGSDWLFPSRSRPGDHLTTRQYGRLFDN